MSFTFSIIAPLASMYQVEGDQTGTRFCYYNTTVSRPSTEANTTEDTKTPNTNTLSITTSARTDTGDVRIKLPYSEENKEIYEKFFEKVKEAIVFKTTDDEYLTLEEMGDQNAIHYIDDLVQQAQYVNMYKDSGIKIAVLNGPLDHHFISFLEYKNPGKVKFVRVDSDVTDNMKDSSSEFTKEQLDKLAEVCAEDFKKISGNEKLNIKVEAMKSPMPAILLLSEEARRMQEMAKMYGSFGFPMENDVTIVLNASNKTVQKLQQLKESGANPEDVDLICGQIYDLATLAHQPMEAEAMTRFIERSAKILDKITE